MSFIELFDFIIYQHLNKRTNILPLATSQNSPFMPPVSSCLHCQFLSHVLKALFFNRNSPKIKLFLQKNAKFSSAGGSAPRPLCLRHQTSQTAPSIANFWLRACSALVEITSLGWFKPPNLFYWMDEESKKLRKSKNSRISKK